MHVASLGNPNPNGLSWLSRLFTRVVPNCAIHTTCMGTLWPRLSPRRFTDNWCAFWDPPFMVQFSCLNRRCPMSHQPYSVAKDTSAHPGDRHPTINRHPSSCRLWDIGSFRLWDPAYVAHHYLAVNDVWGLVGTQAPQSQAVNLFSEETKSSPLATYVALCERTWTVHRSDVSSYLF